MALDRVWLAGHKGLRGLVASLLLAVPTDPATGGAELFSLLMAGARTIRKPVRTKFALLIIDAVGDLIREL